MSRTDVTVWFCPISSWPMQYLMGFCRTLKINMHRRSLKVLARSRVGWQERLDPMSPRRLFRRRSTMWNILPMMSLKRSKKWLHRLNRYRTAKSRWRVRLKRKSLSRMGLTSPKPTRFLTCYCRKGWSSWSHITRFHRRTSSRIWSTTSGTTPCRMIQMSAKSSNSRFNWPLSRGR